MWWLATNDHSRVDMNGYSLGTIRYSSLVSPERWVLFFDWSNFGIGVT
jgi:hypothetical protein